MKLIKKNQLTILVLALMLVTAGYLNYNSSVKETSTQIASIGDATLVSSNISNSISNQVKDENQNVNVSAENFKNLFSIVPAGRIPEKSLLV